MKKILPFLLINFLGLLVIAACNSTSGTVVPAFVPSTTPPATAEQKSLPTPVPPGQAIVYNELQVTMDRAEITDSYLTEYESNRVAPADKEFLWVHIIIKNIAQKEQGLPAVEHFSALSGTTEFKPTYGHRKGYVDYMALNTVVNQGKRIDAWLLFDVFVDSELKDLIFAFLPESSQISFGFSSGQYFWADHPIYLWTCAP